MYTKKKHTWIETKQMIAHKTTTAEIASCTIMVIVIYKELPNSVLDRKQNLSP